MKTFLLALLTFIGVSICAPQADARDYGRNYNHGYYRGRPVYSRAYSPYRSHGYYGSHNYGSRYYGSHYYYPRARYYYGGYGYPRYSSYYGGCGYPAYYSSYYGGCGYPAYYSCFPRLSFSFCF